MARSLEEFDLETLRRPDRILDPRRLDRTAARAIALAISSLLITTLVVTTSASALEPDGTIAGNSFEAGTITLRDDDQGRSMVNLADMAPGRAVAECITVEYTGSVLPVDLSIAASADGPLANYLRVEAELGTGGGFESCSGFQPETTVLTGTLADIVEQGSINVASFVNTGDAVTFRFEFEVLDDGRAMGTATAADFVWEVVPR